MEDNKRGSYTKWIVSISVAIILVLILIAGAIISIENQRNNEGSQEIEDGEDNDNRDDRDDSDEADSTEEENSNVEEPFEGESFELNLEGLVGVNLISEFENVKRDSSETGLEFTTSGLKDCYRLETKLIINPGKSLEQFIAEDYGYSDYSDVQSLELIESYQIFGMDTITMAPDGIGDGEKIYKELPNNKAIITISIYNFVPEGGGDEFYSQCQSLYGQDKIDQIIQKQLNEYYLIN